MNAMIAILLKVMATFREVLVTQVCFVLLVHLSIMSYLELGKKYDL